jgi:hypothetical protein
MWDKYTKTAPTPSGVGAVLVALSIYLTPHCLLPPTPAIALTGLIEDGPNGSHIISLPRCPQGIALLV